MGDMTFVGPNGALLSGGQRQRIAIARCLYSRAAVTIMDNPFNCLDSEVQSQWSPKNSGQPSSAAKGPVFWSSPIFLELFSYFIRKMVSRAKSVILDLSVIFGPDKLESGFTSN